MKLVAWLQRREMSQQEFAELIGGNQSQVSRYCTDQSIPTRALMREIVRVTRGRVRPDDFYEIAEPPKIQQPRRGPGRPREIHFAPR